jgi:hypothetical protein
MSLHQTDALAAKLADHGIAFSAPLNDTHDGLRGFEIGDPNGYVLFFGRQDSRTLDWVVSQYEYCSPAASNIPRKWM